MSTEKIKAIIVDDEPLARDVLKSHIDGVSSLELVASCKNAIEANDVIKENDIDIVFLDIEMPQISGIEFVKTLKNPPRIIFTTAYPNYAVEGFELDATDYLLKPVSMDRFMKAVNRATEEIELQNMSTDKSEDEDFIYVKADKKLVKIDYSEIYYIEGLKDYVIIKRENDRVITLQTMKFLESTLPRHLFRRVHRSYIVSLGHIQALNGNMVELLVEGKRKNIPIGKNYKDEIINVVNRNKL